VQVANLSAETVTLRAVKAVLPLGGLKQVSQTWAPCGTLPDGLVPGPVTLQPGASTWLSVTFNVQKGCPAPYPVQFSVGYRAGGRAATASLPGFPDLGSVPYSACPPSGQLAEQRVVLITP
jgi:hypothetical protein